MWKGICSFIVVCILSLCCSTGVYASVTLNSGNFDAVYWEPTTSEDGTLLQDLAYTSIYYKLDGGSRVLVTTVPASDVTGGGKVTQSFTISGLGNQVDVEITYTATDKVGNESTDEYVEPTIRIDKVSPSHPQGE